MFDLKRLEIAIEIDSNELQILIQNASQSIINQAIKKNFPLLGAVEIQVIRLDTPTVKISANILKFLHLIAVKINPSSSLIPEIHGEMRLESDLLMVKTDESTVDYKITQAQWIDGPTTQKGKSLGLVRKLTSVLLKNTDIIESLVEDRIRESLTSAGLRSMLQKVPKQVAFSNLTFHLATLHILGWDLLVEEPHLRIKAVLDAQVDINRSDNPAILVESQGYEVPETCELFLSDILMTKILSSQLDKINTRLDTLPTELKDAKIEIDQGNIILWLLPSQLRKPIRISLALHFDKKTNCIVLDRCDLDSSSKSGFLVKGAIKLFGGKLEEFIARYFPITLSPLIDKAILAKTKSKPDIAAKIEQTKVASFKPFDPVCPNICG